MTTTVVAATTIVRTRTIIVNAATRILPLLALITGSAYAVESTPAPATPGGHWISPLLMASQTLALAQPAVVRAEREVQRSALVEYQVLARWNPELTLGATHDENNRRSTNTYDGNGVIRDRNTAGTAAIGNTFSTGTTVKVQAGSTEYHTSNPSALDPLYYNSTVQLVVSQALLQGGSREVNRAELINAQVQAEADRDLRDDQLETLFASLGEDWLNLSQRQAEVRLRREHLELTRRNLQQSEERSRLGLGRELDVFSLRRDVAAQEAALAAAERAETGIHERLTVSWPKLSLPASEHLSVVSTTMLEKIHDYVGDFPHETGAALSVTYSMLTSVLDRWRRDEATMSAWVSDDSNRVGMVAVKTMTRGLGALSRQLLKTQKLLDGHVAAVGGEDRNDDSLEE